MMTPLRRLPLTRLTPDAPDRELLERYVRERDERAFAALVARHGRMVRAVCRRVLGHDADADDAAQATFLVLVRKAASIRDRNGLANWLFGVAHNVAAKARQTRTRRQTKEAKTPPRPPEAVASDFAELLHTELAKLPAAYRAVVVLCDLEGETIADAAKQLGIPTGTVASRLARGRTRLANRLRSLGLGVSVGLVAALLSESAAAAVGVSFNPGVEVSEPVQLLGNEVMRTMFTTPKTKLLAVALTGAFALSLAAVGVAQAPPRANPPKADPAKTDDNDSRSRPAPPKGFAPFSTLSQAVVKWDDDDDDKLSVRAEMPVGRSLKLTDAKWKAVFVNELTHQKCGPVVMAVDDVELFDVAGNKKAKADWKKLLKDGTPVLYVVKETHNAKAFREQFEAFLKDDALVLVVPQKVNDQFEPFKNLPAIDSLPQVFPGQAPKPGDQAIPPPKLGGDPIRR